MHLIMFAFSKHSVSFCFLRYSLQSLSSWDCHQYRRVVDQCLRLLMHFGWLCGITIGAIIFFQTSFYRCSLFAVRSSIYIYKNNIEAGRMASLKKWMWITQMHLDVRFFVFSLLLLPSVSAISSCQPHTEWGIWQDKNIYMYWKRSQKQLKTRCKSS